MAFRFDWWVAGEQAEWIIRSINHPDLAVGPACLAVFVMIWLITTALLAGSNLAVAQDASQRPALAGEVVGALAAARWDELDNGLSVVQVDTALGTKVTAISIDLRRFRLGILQQETPKGERVRRVLARTDAVLVSNGGFFARSEDETLRPVGMLILDGVELSSHWEITGGYLALDAAGMPAITLSPSGPPAWARNAVQSKPVLIEPGGRWAMNTNGTELARRTLFCLIDEETAVLVLVHGNGLTLFEAGWTMRGKQWGGFFGCDSAIALDGGGSTQLAVQNEPQLSISGLTDVQNFLAVFPIAAGDDGQQDTGQEDIGQEDTGQ